MQNKKLTPEEIEQLETAHAEQVSQLTDLVNEKDLKIAELENTHNERVNQLTGLVNEKDLQIAELEKTLTQHAQVIAEQSKHLDDATQTTKIEEAKPKKLTIPEKPVEVNGKFFIFQMPAFRMPGEAEIILAEDAALREDILADILKIEGQGILKEVV